MNSSKEAIIAAIKKNKPDLLPLPEHPEFPYEDNLIEQFQASIKLNGGTARTGEGKAAVQAYLKDNYTPDNQVLSMVDGITGNFDIGKVQDPHELEHIEVAILEGDWGVVENAAIWLPEEKIVHRALPFIAQHLIVLLKVDRLLGNMHEVYQKINVAEPGYGVFVAGPSKTADIEQSLVIGAHGPRSMVVFLMA
ncbi:LUD domain-containing protein [uncultured Cyclobacterium sp.]|uniref:LutC/YkgG family protein n=1 Tax=uncultured Cyclobacterium sp. TaxID=453820 RepID=UPI0030EB82EF